MAQCKNIQRSHNKSEISIKESQVVPEPKLQESSRLENPTNQSSNPDQHVVTETKIITDDSTKKHTLETSDIVNDAER